MSPPNLTMAVLQYPQGFRAPHDARGGTMHAVALGVHGF